MRCAGASFALALVCGNALAADAPIAAAPLPFAAKRIPASVEECAVWRREQTFARSVERHDARAFAEHLHPGTIFDAGHAEADRGRDAVTAAWAPIIAGTGIALRWRPGIVHIGGEPSIAISRGPFILHRSQNGADVFRIGFYQTVCLRDPRDGVWHVLYDAGASTAQPMADRAAAERWVVEQEMSDCAP